MRVTIYTPTKNRKEALAKAIDSVLNQTYQDVEMIVVNDGSTDGTAEYLEGRAKLDSRLKQIIALRPDAICTDYPDYCQKLINEIQKD